MSGLLVFLCFGFLGWIVVGEHFAAILMIVGSVAVALYRNERRDRVYPTNGGTATRRYSHLADHSDTPRTEEPR